MVYHLAIHEEQSLVAANSKFEWRLDGGKYGGENGEDDIDMHEIMQIEEQPETGLLEVNKYGIKDDQENDKFQEDSEVVNN